jgi:signal transduction histidine kinase
MPLKNFLLPPVFPHDEEKTRQALFLYIILFSIIILLSLLLIFRSIMPGNDRVLPFVILTSLILLSLFLMALSNRGFTRTACFIFAFAAWTGMTIEAVFADGIRDVTMVANMIVILLGTLLLGQRTAIVLALLTIVSVWVLTFLEVKEIIHPLLDNTLNLARDLTTIYMLVGLLIYLYTRSQRIAMQRLKNELTERKQTEKKLRVSEHQLKVQNFEYQTLNERLKTAIQGAKESDRLKTTFLQNMSHEIRSPMNAIMGFSSLIQDPDTTREEISGYSRIIINSSKQLLSVVSDILAIAVIETGQVDILNRKVNVNRLMTELQLEFKSLYTDKNLTFKLVTSMPDDIATITTDESKLKHILLHLIQNAIKFTDQGGIETGCSLHEDMLWFYVKDTGIGIDPVHHEKIFERFHQADDSIRHNYGGNGLGLAISKAYTELLGGTMHMTSEPGTGSLFSFSIPYKKVPDV